MGSLQYLRRFFFESTLTNKSLLTVYWIEARSVTAAFVNNYRFCSGHWQPPSVRRRASSSEPSTQEHPRAFVPAAVQLRRHRQAPLQLQPAPSWPLQPRLRTSASSHVVEEREEKWELLAAQSQDTMQREIYLLSVSTFESVLCFAQDFDGYLWKRRQLHYFGF